MIEFGWINANAMTVIDLARRRYCATVLLDHREDGSADPWGVALPPDGTWLWVTLSGSHQLGRLDLRLLHAQLVDCLPAPMLRVRARP